MEILGFSAMQIVIIIGATIVIAGVLVGILYATHVLGGKGKENLADYLDGLVFVPAARLNDDACTATPSDSVGSEYQFWKKHPSRNNVINTFTSPTGAWADKDECLAMTTDTDLCSLTLKPGMGLQIDSVEPSGDILKVTSGKEVFEFDLSRKSHDGHLVIRYPYYYGGFPVC